MSPPKVFAVHLFSVSNWREIKSDNVGNSNMISSAATKSYLCVKVKDYKTFVESSKYMRC